MNSTRLIMMVSSILLVAVGLVFLFLPDALTARLNPESDPARIVVQLAGAGILGFAVLNWMGRGAIYGGIYGRPIVIANMGFALIAALSMVRWILDTGGTPVGWALTVVFLLCLVGFAIILRRQPWQGRR